MSGAFPGKQQRLLSAWGLLGGGVRAGVDGGCTHPSPRPPPTTGGVFFPPHGGSAAKPVVNSHGKRVSFVRSASYPVPPPTPSRLAAIPAQRLADSGPVRPRLGERFHPPYNAARQRLPSAALPHAGQPIRRDGASPPTRRTAPRRQPGCVRPIPRHADCPARRHACGADAGDRRPVLHPGDCPRDRRRAPRQWRVGRHFRRGRLRHRDRFRPAVARPDSPLRRRAGHAGRYW